MRILRQRARRVLVENPRKRIEASDARTAGSENKIRFDELSLSGIPYVQSSDLCWCFTSLKAEYGGAWAMATFIEATETSDVGKRKELMDKIVAYNKEDLEATWAVFEWLKSKVPAPNPERTRLS